MELSLHPGKRLHPCISDDGWETFIHVPHLQTCCPKDAAHVLGGRIPDAESRLL